MTKKKDKLKMTGNYWNVKETECLKNNYGNWSEICKKKYFNKDKDINSLK